VLNLLSTGLSTRQIAHRMDMSCYTAQDHLRAIYRKTGRSSRSELIASLTF
jgi:DNA-binding CsgD family transcriptional regulator